MAHTLSHSRWSVALLAVAFLTGWGAAPARAVDGVIELESSMCESIPIRRERR